MPIWLPSPFQNDGKIEVKTVKYSRMNTPKILRQAFLVALSLLILLPCTRCVSEPKSGSEFFKKAEPVWPTGLELEKNITVGFRASFEKPESGSAVLNITGSSLYRIYLNGKFVGHGPARAGHGHYRVDEWDLGKSMVTGTNVVAIEVAGYNVNSFYLLDQPSFLQAEVVSGNKVLAATRAQSDDFEAFLLPERVQKVPRYSFQRPFTEVYRMEEGDDGWRIGQKAEGRRQKGGEKVKVERTGVKKLVERRIPYPDFTIKHPVNEVSNGFVKTGIVREKYWTDRAVANIDIKLGGFPEGELEINPAIPLQEMENDSILTGAGPYIPGGPGLMLGDKQFRLFDFGTNLTGFVAASIEVTKPGRVYLTFDEILTGDDVNFRRLGCINAVVYDLAPGKYDIESFEPYTFRYLKVIMTGGECTLNTVSLREYVNPDIRSNFESSDERLNRIYTAGVETFRQNAVDIFMDCPHRERAGWLCDSYFTARVANDVSGNTLIEKNFYENFLLPDSFAFIPEGMLPMCYPADHNDSVFIPNWAMWFVVELKEYLYRSNDRQLVDDLKPRVMNLLNYFEPFKNSDGLLEKLDSWIFVEWSAANRFVQDVNYPTNMLFAATLDAAGELYGIDSLKTEAAAIRETIRKQSYNGTFFVDNAIRAAQNGELAVTGNTTEVCQYFAFYFGVATPETYPELWKKLATQFGPGRKENNPYPDVHFANSFVGNYLRLELLSQNNLRAQLLGESIDLFDYMAVQTGTLWENVSAEASCNHGFASHVVHVLFRDVLGVADINIINNKITLQISDTGLHWCRGVIPIGDRQLNLQWERTGDAIRYSYTGAEGYEVEVINNSGLTLIKQ
jgi:alpha-L-rhamnosidase